MCVGTVAASVKIGATVAKVNRRVKRARHMIFFSYTQTNRKISTIDLENQKTQYGSGSPMFACLDLGAQRHQEATKTETDSPSQFIAAALSAEAISVKSQPKAHRNVHSLIPISTNSSIFGWIQHCFSKSGEYHIEFITVRKISYYFRSSQNEKMCIQSCIGLHEIPMLQKGPKRLRHKSKNGR